MGKENKTDSGKPELRDPYQCGRESVCDEKVNDHAGRDDVSELVQCGV